MKKISVLVLLLSLSCVILFQASFTFKKPQASCISQEEKKLYNLIMAYRKEKGLASIPLSSSLSKVAMMHTLDLSLNKPKPPCNLHSWSGAMGVTPCCYTKDGSQAACMWSKPKELTTYLGEGYEIAAYSSEALTSEKVLDMWKKSQGHNNVIVNKGSWTAQQWKAIGLSIYKNYAVVWFGELIDKEPAPSICK